MRSGAVPSRTVATAVSGTWPGTEPLLVEVGM